MRSVVPLLAVNALAPPQIATDPRAADVRRHARPVDEQGWDPYQVWYTRVLLPRRSAERAASDARAIAAGPPAA